MTTRAERMQQRMRGAGHGQVEDVSFQLDFGDDLTTEVEPQTSPERAPPRTTPTPNTSAKRRKLEGDATRPAGSRPGSVQSRQSQGKPDVYEIPEGSSTESAQAAAEDTTTSPNNTVSQDEPNSVESLPPAKLPAPAQSTSPPSRRAAAEHTEVGESPVGAPGSGRRRTVTTSSAVASSARLQDVLSPEENATETVPISSPLERKVRRTTASTRRSTMSSRGSRKSAVSSNAEESSPSRVEDATARTLSPDLTSPRQSLPDESSAQPKGLEQEEAADPEPESAEEQAPESPLSTRHARQRAEPDHDESLAEEINVEEAAQRLGRKRPRTSLRRQSAEPDSTIVEEAPEEPLPKRRRKQPQASPAKQKQGRPKGPPKTTSNTTSKTKSSSPKAAPKRRKQKGSDGTENEETVSIPVQRFTKRATIAEGDEDDADVLNLEIPFVNRGGVNTIDVLSQMCDEIIGAALDTVKEGIRGANDAASKKEYRIKLRAVEAYQEELRNRFLQHTILVDALHSLRKRVRSVQKERIAVRDEIMRIRAEREQVAVRKDAVRIKHDKNQLSLSSQMHDIDLAVERGRAAPELDPAEKKTAELANLEILISRITDQACTRSDTGGTLKQIKDFNAFLERAAVALESR
ncbi:hypothetical protein C8034_v002574 [Colletotrichum sidae]|uniref:Inner kinetochore subunit AME1 domain-containing protein n=1 Tax=Colletotrichum sidae TaxID=1347389 RepID=A0A4R8TCM4_9PEZI|nr:hypothetical protein C8034_v002574 [Colletotrichum sidae]